MTRIKSILHKYFHATPRLLVCTKNFSIPKQLLCIVNFRLSRDGGRHGPTRGRKDDEHEPLVSSLNFADVRSSTGHSCSGTVVARTALDIGEIVFRKFSCSHQGLPRIILRDRLVDKKASCVGFGSVGPQAAFTRISLLVWAATRRLVFFTLHN